MELAEAHALICRAMDSGKAAHGYLVCGEIGGNCLDLVMGILHRLFPDAAEQVENRTHPDVFWLEPQGKSRMIKVARGKDDDGPGMRDGMINPLSVTAYSGGWKVGVIVAADRMHEAAANSFLKTLEEPPSKTMFFLLTDQPDLMLPTIVSRVQRVDLPMPNGLLEGEAYDAVRQEFVGGAGEGVWARGASGRRLASLLAQLKDAADGERLPQVRKAFFRTILSFVRGWMVEGRVPAYQAFRNVEAVEAAYRQSDRAIGDEAVLCFLMDRLVFPQ